MTKLSIEDLKKFPKGAFYIIFNGRLVEDYSTLQEFDAYHVIPRVLGGKGGFGSLLRSFGSQFYKSTNQDMCRDLTGRRLKDVKEEEKLKKYIKKAGERDEAKRKKLEEKYEKLKKIVPAQDGSSRPTTSTHQFNDPEYSKTKQQISDETEDAVKAGLKLAMAKGSTVEEEDEDQPGTSGNCSTTTATRKRPADSNDNDKELKIVKKKKPNDMWLGIANLDEDSLSESDEDEKQAQSSSVSKKF